MLEPSEELGSQGDLPTLPMRGTCGSTGEVDFSARQWQGIFCSQLQDPAYFRQVAVDPELGTARY